MASKLSNAVITCRKLHHHHHKSLTHYPLTSNACLPSFASPFGSALSGSDPANMLRTTPNIVYPHGDVGMPKCPSHDNEQRIEMKITPNLA